jgi:hypothetical protein
MGIKPEFDYKSLRHSHFRGNLLLLVKAFKECHLNLKQIPHIFFRFSTENCGMTFCLLFSR